MSANRLARIEWNAKYDLGMDLIDQQHRRIAEYYNRLADIREGVDERGDSVDLVMAALIEYTRHHFEFEETLMEVSGYAYLKAHRRIHELFVKHLERWAERMAAGEDITAALGAMLEHWLYRHIEGEDRDYRDKVAPVLSTVVREPRQGLLSRLRHLKVFS